MNIKKYFGIRFNPFQPGLRRKSPEIVVSVMQELVRRGGIKSAVAGRDGSSLQILLRFIQK